MNFLVLKIIKGSEYRLLKNMEWLDVICRVGRRIRVVKGSEFPIPGVCPSPRRNEVWPPSLFLFYFCRNAGRLECMEKEKVHRFSCRGCF